MRLSLLLVGATLFCSAAQAQTAFIDQVSPDLGAAFNRNDPGKVWQQQVRTGYDGQLEGIRLYFDGVQGARADIRLRRGAGWNQTPPIWSGSYTKTTGAAESPFIDLTSADLQFDADEVFVIELQGDGSGMIVLGSYQSPSQGPAHYAEDLFLNGPTCYADCGWRVAFQTWTYVVGTNYCEAAPNSTGSRASMTFTGSTSVAANNLTLYSVPVPKGPGFFFYGQKKTRLALGNGFICVGAPFQRLGITFSSQGRLEYPLDLTSLPAGWEILAGTRWNFQSWFRDKNAGGMKSNFSDGLMLEFTQ